MKKVVCILLVIIIVLLALTLGRYVFDNKLSAKAINQLREDYFKEYRYEIPEGLDKWYCGTYRGNIAFYPWFVGHYCALMDVNIGGVEYTYPDSRQVLIYRDGKFYTMSEAYEKGLIGYLDIYVIFYKYELNVKNDRFQIN